MASRCSRPRIIRLSGLSDQTIGLVERHGEVGQFVSALHLVGVRQPFGFCAERVTSAARFVDSTASPNALTACCGVSKRFPVGSPERERNEREKQNREECFHGLHRYMSQGLPPPATAAAPPPPPRLAAPRLAALCAPPPPLLTPLNAEEDPPLGRLADAEGVGRLADGVDGRVLGVERLGRLADEPAPATGVCEGRVPPLAEGTCDGRFAPALADGCAGRLAPALAEGCDGRLTPLPAAGCDGRVAPPDAEGCEGRFAQRRFALADWRSRQQPVARIELWKLMVIHCSSRGPRGFARTRRNSARDSGPAAIFAAGFGWRCSPSVFVSWSG